MTLLRRLVKEEEGQGLVEYALIIALISIAVMGAMKLLSVDIGKAFDKIAAELPD